MWWLPNGAIHGFGFLLLVEITHEDNKAIYRCLISIAIDMNALLVAVHSHFLGKVLRYLAKLANIDQ